MGAKATCTAPVDSFVVDGDVSFSPEGEAEALGAGTRLRLISVCVYFTGALQSSAMMSLVRGAAYAAVFMAGQGCTLGHLFRFSEEGPVLCRLRSSPVFVSEFPAQGACIQGNGFKFQANLQLGKGKEGVESFFFF